MADLRNYFVNTLLIPAAATDALIKEGGLAGVNDCIIKDKAVLKIVKNCRKLFQPPVGAVVPLAGRGAGRGTGRGGSGPAPGRITARYKERFRQLAFFCFPPG